MKLALVIDTSLNACTAGLFDGDTPVAQATEAMSRGHQERIGTMVAEVFDLAGVTPLDLAVIGVTLGPGSFTGLRVGLSFAKGLGVGLRIPPKGIGTLEALGHHPSLLNERRMAVIDGGRGQIYAQYFTPQGQSAPLHLNAEADFTPYDAAVLTGPGAALLAPYFPHAAIDRRDWPTAEALNALARTPGHDDLSPLYMREADAVVSTRGVIAPLGGGALSA